MEAYSIVVVREAGTDGAGGPFLPRAEEQLVIEAVSQQEAYQKSQFMSKLKFMGQHRRTYINGVEHLDKRY